MRLSNLPRKTGFLAMLFTWALATTMVAALAPQGAPQTPPPNYGQVPKPLDPSQVGDAGGRRGGGPGRGFFGRGRGRGGDPGAQIYNEQCLGCHGNSLSGGRAPSLLDDVWNIPNTDESLKNTILQGVSGTEMEGFEGVLTSEQVDSVIAYIRNRAKQASTVAARAPSPANKVIQSEHGAFKIEVVADGFDTPWGVAELPDGRFLVTERGGTLRVVDHGKLLPPVDGIPKVWVKQDGGLFDVELHPHYSDPGNGWIYLSYSQPGPNDSSMTTIVRGHLRDNKWVDQQYLYNPPAAMYTTSNIHYGSRFTFDRQGHLFYSIGERGDQNNAQDLTNPKGKVHRVNDDGSIPKDNPFVGQPGVDESIWTYGHRNPQGFSWDPVTGELWEAEHGPTGGDEINIIKKGHDYGWPLVQYGTRQVGTETGGPAWSGKYDNPVMFWTPTIAPSGIAFYTGNKFPAWKNNLLVTGLGGEAFRRLEIKKDKVAHEEILFSGFGRVRDVIVGHDGYPYILIQVPGIALSDPNPGMLVRLVPVSK
ncbi:MAG TPA: PQQ-dependent sugar dehydrogenase [Vicinamibacterales bacterium]|nr:PQQ-dependent sugar dehydrogenase [Vicinamibacterales bacterium]